MLQLLGVDISVCLPPTRWAVLSKHCQQQQKIDMQGLLLFEPWHSLAFDPAKLLYFSICLHAILQLLLSS